MKGLLTQYLAAGDLADRPTAPDIADGCMSLYHALDTGEVFKWTPIEPEEEGDPTGAWSQISVLEAPDTAGLYVRNGDAGVWELAPIQTDAPIDGTPYMRQDEDWVSYEAPTPDVLEAPEDGTLYGRKDGAWEAVPDAGITDAPEDGNQYARKDGSWEIVESGEGDASYPDFVGNAGKVLAVNEDEDGVEWVEVEGGGGGSVVPGMRRIATVDLGGLSTYTFPNIPQDGQELRLVITGRAAGSSQLRTRINGLSTAIYDWQRKYVHPTTENRDSSTDQTSLTTNALFNTFSATAVELVFPNYTSTTDNKAILSTARAADGLKTAFILWTFAQARTPNAITSITIDSAEGLAWSAGSEATLYVVGGTEAEGSPTGATPPTIVQTAKIRSAAGSTGSLTPAFAGNVTLGNTVVYLINGFANNWGAWYLAAGNWTRDMRGGDPVGNQGAAIITYAPRLAENGKQMTIGGPNGGVNILALELANFAGFDIKYGACEKSVNTMYGTAMGTPGALNIIAFQSDGSGGVTATAYTPGLVLLYDASTSGANHTGYFFQVPDELLGKSVFCTLSAECFSPIYTNFTLHGK